jgi:hypothetical protein
VIAREVNSMDLSFRYGLWNLGIGPGGPAALARLIDVWSWVDYTLLTELSMNLDGYYKSTFFYAQVMPNPDLFLSLHRDTCIHTPVVMGPAWDFDLAFANSGGENGGAVRDSGAVRSEACRFSHLIYADDPNIRMPHVASLWNDNYFKQALKGRWRVLRRTILSESNIMNLIDEFSKSTEKSREADRALWASRLWPRDGGAWPQPCDIRDTSLAAEVETLKDFIRHRLDFMDQYLGSF